MRSAVAGRIFLKPTIGPLEDDWNIGRVSLLARHLAVLQDARRRRARPRKHPRNREILPRQSK
jgi:hypothetical protein